MNQTGKKTLVYGILTFFSVASLSLIPNRSVTFLKAAEHPGNVATLQSYPNEVFNGTLNENWDWVGISNSATTNTRTWNSAIRVYNHSSGNGGEFRVVPSSTNGSMLLTEVTISSHATSGGTPTYEMLISQDGSTWTSEQTGTIAKGRDYIYTNLDGFRYFSIKNTATSSNQIHFTTVTFDYKDDDATYDPVESSESNVLSPKGLYIGEEFEVHPTILPSTASQGFTLEAIDPGVEIIGNKIRGVSEGQEVQVKITTVGLTVDNIPLEEVISFDVSQARTTVAEGLTLTPNTGIVYLVENATISDAYNTQYDRQLQIQDALDPSIKILIFQYDINPINSYKYIKGGTISFKAPLGQYNNVNQFVTPEILDYSDAVEVFATNILSGDEENQCITLFLEFKTIVLGFSSDELTKLKLGTLGNIPNARNSYLAWATSLGKDPYQADTVLTRPLATKSNNNVGLLVLISLIGLSSVAGLYFYKSRRQQNHIWISSF